MENNSNQNSENEENNYNENSKEEEINEKEIEELNNIENNQNEEELNNDINIENENEEINNEPIYVMTLALEKGKSEKIEIYENSEPAQLAYDFCNKNNLDFNALDYLKEQITNLLDSYNKNEDNEEIDIPEIEEEQEYNITDNYKDNTYSSKTENLNIIKIYYTPS